MTSTWKGSSGRDGRPSGQGVEPGENQLDLFKILPRASMRPEQPPAVSGDDGAVSLVVEQRPVETCAIEPSAADSSNPATATPKIMGSDNAETIVDRAARHALDVALAPPDDLRRLEESIRWLMNAGAMPLPQTVTLPPVADVTPLDLGPHDDDGLLLDPDTLFSPRPPRRSGPIVAGAAKVLLVSAIAAPTAYFTASWLQFPGVAAPSDPAAVAAVAMPVAGEQVVAAAPAPSIPAPPVPAPRLSVSSAPQAAHDGVEVPTAPPQPEPAAAPQPATRAAGVVVAAIAPGPATAVKAAPEPPPTAVAQPGDQVSTPIPVLHPVKPLLGQQEIAMMIERGRVLFEAGDVAAARLFFRRAASAGDTAAAIAMGATYDPEVLTQRFIRGIEADAQEAQRWYERARDMGGQRVELAQHR
jgi:hypothetical protein